MVWKEIIREEQPPRSGLVQHIAAPRLGARAAATSYKPER